MVGIQRHEIPILTTFDPPPGYEIERVIGPCWGITVRSRSVLGTTCAGFQAIFGGEITMFTELANDSRNEAMNRLEQHARKMGANGILGTRFDSSELANSVNEILAYGTAVVLRLRVAPQKPSASRAPDAPTNKAQEPLPLDSRAPDAPTNKTQEPLPLDSCAPDTPTDKKTVQDA
jgi:uncharacterized protein YbjQ (UPF0145 family)